MAKTPRDTQEMMVTIGFIAEKVESIESDMHEVFGRLNIDENRLTAIETRCGDVQDRKKVWYAAVVTAILASLTALLTAMWNFLRGAGHAG